MHQPTMVAAPIPQPPWYPTPGFEAHNNQPTCRFATGLHHKKMYYLLYYYYIQRIDNNGQQCGCRQQCVKQCMGRLWQFRCNGFVLRTYWHHPVARFPRRRGRRQSEHGQRRGNLGGSPLVDLPHQWAPLGDVAKFGNTPPLFCSHGCCW